MTVSYVLQVGREHMMHQNVRFNFPLNLEDDGEIKLKLRGRWRSNKGQNAIFSLKKSNFGEVIAM